MPKKDNVLKLLGECESLLVDISHEEGLPEDVQQMVNRLSDKIFVAKTLVDQKLVPEQENF